jgi:hypothetical protein
VLGLDSGEVAPVQRSDVGQLQPFGGGDDRRVDGAQRQIRVRAHEFGHARYVGGGDRDVPELACRDRFDEGRLMSGRSSTSQHTSTMTVVGISSGPSADSSRAAQRA